MLLKQAKQHKKNILARACMALSETKQTQGKIVEVMHLSHQIV